jgi:hypothetical protein
MRRVAAGLAALLLAQGAVAVVPVHAALAAPALVTPPDEPPPTPAPPPTAAPPPPTAAAAPVPTPVRPRQAPAAGVGSQPAQPAGAPPAPAPAEQPAPLRASDIVPPLPPRTGPEPSPGSRHARPAPATASDVPRILPWAVVPGIAVLLAVLLVAGVWLVRWPWRLVSTARVAMVTPVAAPVGGPTPSIALGAAAQRLPPSMQRDLIELAALLEEADVGGPAAPGS